MTVSESDIRTIRARYESHLNDIEGRASRNNQVALRSGQVGLGRDFISFLREQEENTQKKTSGYFVRPTGTGKTVSLIDMIIGANTQPGGKFVLGNARQQKRTVVMVPQNFLLDQWEDELLGEKQEDGTRKPSKWSDLIKEDHVGIYRASDSLEKKCEALAKPVVVITYDSARIITTGYDESLDVKPETEDNRQILQALFKPEEFSLTLLDEVHDRPRGEATGAFIKNHFMGKSMVVGATATHLYKSGKTIGDYLFDGQIPFHETTFREAVNNREICPMRNIIAEVELSSMQEGELRNITNAALARAQKNGAKPHELDYTEDELERIVKITQQDEAAIRLLQRGFDPDTGKKYRDMKQVWYCASINHAKSVAEKINNIMGKDYAMAVHGEMNGEVQDRVLINYKKGDHRALTNCTLLTMGFDDKEAELCMQLVPTRSPNRSMQQGGRVMRLDPKNPNKIANIVTFVYPAMEQVIFGELAQGMLLIPQGQEFSSPEGPAAPQAPARAWPPIEGLKVSYTTEQLQLFVEKREKQRYANGLPVKSDHMLTVEEMAAKLFPKAKGPQLSRETARLQHRIYEPLRAAFDMRDQRQQFVGLKDAESRESISALGQRFPTWRIGHCNYQRQDRFCIDKDLATVCRHALYGRVNTRTSNLLSESAAQKLLGLDDATWGPIIERIKEAFLDRKGYERMLRLGDVAIPHEMIGYYRSATGGTPNQANVEFCMTPDALLPIYQLAKKVDATTAKTWRSQHTQLPKLKTIEWLGQQDVKDMLGITALDPKNDVFSTLWASIKRTHQSVGTKTGVGEEKDISVSYSPRKQISLRTAKKITFSDREEAVCVHKDELDKLRFALGIESSYEPEKQSPAKERQ